MALHRRRVLAATGAAGAGILGLGYWQRRRIRRYPSVLDLREVTGSEVPRIEDDQIITSTLLDASYDRAVERFEEIEPRLDPPYDRYSEEFIENLRARLSDRAPETVTIWSRGVPAMHYARRQALFTYRRVRSRLVGILAHEAPDELPFEPFAERASALEERIESVSVPYRGASFGEAIVAGSTIESALGEATSALENAREEDERRDRWRQLERATAAVEDAESLVETRSGENHRPEFSAAAERLVDEYEHHREAAPARHEAPEIDGANSTFAMRGIGALQRPMRNLGGTPEIASRLFDDGDHGRAAHTHVLLLPTIPLYEAFSDVPNPVWWEEIDYEHGADPDDLRARKRAAIDTVEPYLDRDDPLVGHLAAVPLGVVRATDSRVERLTEDAHAVDDSEWAMQLDLALLLYESARRYAEAIDEVIDVVDDL
ncbi:Uncharacterized protein AArcCO_2165 [Halalkaliarchaeum sp. AArc-CO]|uniref:hypothetical protein n=1 Tax=unclassified Halalkaliarchaeum TaxID=2678344 RepID=UPI00217D8C22|nr:MULTISPECIES: hypothetical protein [unclassified Halalkaliarchaeum]MDR5671953.1 hypothetical protein [Halalkaliarchaeum sp. AArc-GB]UWG51459.1 Uncharacterized protein AArcCO_2165 [Halalkaliarchaeum sp. AArc-CO]